MDTNANFPFQYFGLRKVDVAWRMLDPQADHPEEGLPVDLLRTSKYYIVLSNACKGAYSFSNNWVYKLLAVHVVVGLFNIPS